MLVRKSSSLRFSVRAQWLALALVMCDVTGVTGSPAIQGSAMVDAARNLELFADPDGDLLRLLKTDSIEASNSSLQASFRGSQIEPFHFWPTTTGTADPMDIPTQQPGEQPYEFFSPVHVTHSHDDPVSC